ncbi:MAG: helix-turn-helix domain-containing protein [Patescibacteria group bacterium]|nr:helix-turn-helix domain-containing protein [Patescibacteria group bacterium]
MSQTNRILKKFGLSDTETSVYLEALKHDQLTPYSISKLTGIPRTTVYDILMNLSLKGLVKLQQSDGFSKQQTLVRAQNPSTLRKIIRKKQKDLTTLEVDIVSILPQLNDDFHKSNPNADFLFYPGIEGFQKVYLDRRLLDIDVERYTWDLLMPMDVLGKDKLNKLVDRQHKMFKQHKHKPKEIIPLNNWTKHVLTYQVSRDPKYLKDREIRYIESPAFDLSAEINIIGNQIRISCAQDDEVWGLTISSKALSKTFRSIFLVQWAMAKKISPELVKSWGENKFLKAERKK